ncbi:choloylglycine hydrolase [Carnobacterium sp. TMP28]|uniref:choloylglycine hydrolase n=1 Tax=Carnobacterium sp. TMP28 TaxID=3397060 RepID=UPI0039E100C9
MCTSLTYKKTDFYFGRNMDIEYSFNEKVVITPRKFSFDLKKYKKLESHYAMIGMATVIEDYPLYAEATNEKGLSIAALNFPGNAVYLEEKQGQINITPFELIPWLLGTCTTVEEAKAALQKTNIVNVPFNEQIPLAPQHWMIADRDQCIVVEPMEEGVRIHDNPFGVLTNNPPFEFHKMNMANYLNLTAHYPTDRFSSEIDLKPYGVGMGSLGLPGDVSPASRFVRATFHKMNAISEDNENANLSQFFHILDSVAMVRGSSLTKEGKNDITSYACCVNTEKGIYYYKTYENNQLTAIHMHNENLDSDELITVELIKTQQINHVNN